LKAAVYKKYGSPEVVSILERPVPVPQKNELLIKVHASTVNRTDAGFRSAEYFVSRFFSGLFKPKFQILGCEFAGEVVETGDDISLFEKGDRVFGFDDDKFGGHAEYLTIKETKAIALIPDEMDYQTASALSEGAQYALNFIKASGIKPGENALVYGATGAIGTAAVQILKYLNVNVTAVANTKNIQLIKDLGADEVIDYLKEDFTLTNKRFRFIFDAVGKTSFSKTKHLMENHAIFISTEPGKNGVNIFLALAAPFMGKRKVLFPLPQTRKENIEFIKKIAEEGKFKPVIDRVYPLEQIVEAHKYVETHEKTGNVIIAIR